jgi:hypothetical protein
MPIAHDGSAAIGPHHGPRAMPGRANSARPGPCEKALASLGGTKIKLQVRGAANDVAVFHTSLGYLVEDRITMGKAVDQNIPEDYFLLRLATGAGWFCTAYTDPPGK